MIAARTRRRAFTMVEVMVTTTLAALVMLAVLQAYVFILRSLGRMENFQTLEVRSRTTLAYFTRDVRLASSISSVSASAMTLTLPAGTVTYTYDAGTAQLTRTATFGPVATIILLSEVESGTFTLNFLDAVDTATTAPTDIRKVEIRYAMRRGSTANGTSAYYQAASARIVFRNKNYFSDPS